MRRLSLEEYTELDAVSESRLEFRDGLAVALAVPTKNHARIAGNLVTTLGRLARDRGCDYYAGGAKVVTPAGDRLIPDFLVTCDDRDRELPADRGEALAAHPWLIVEILSPATAADDVTVKFDAYQTIAELRQYVVIDSRRQAMRAYERGEDGSFSTRGGLREISLGGLGDFRLTLDDVYRDTTVPLIGGDPQV